MSRRPPAGATAAVRPRLSPVSGSSAVDAGHAPRERDVEAITLDVLDGDGRVIGALILEPLD
ncbi:MAG: hypothetical protein HS111_23190 [Kofleriaceae bacterium]|nr:hypothetical protein [Kofleriaceae bacterium]MCL4226493.1 hypothetical protein [Myxococcales bacterium]